jgi:hypothetical protein
MSRRSRIDRAFDEVGGGRCDACRQAGPVLAHDPEVCDKKAQADLFPRLQAFTRAGWFRPNAPKHEHVPISDETRALLDSGTLVVDRGVPDSAALAELAEREPQLWRCKEERHEPTPTPCPKCGSVPDVMQFIHSHDAGVM